jgi:hypothetical protein
MNKGTIRKEDPILEGHSDTLVEAIVKKGAKFHLIEEYVRVISKNYQKEINSLYNVQGTEIVTHYIIISRLRVVPKKTIKTVRKILKLEKERHVKQ